MRKGELVLCFALLFLVGCAGADLQGEFQSGRQALLRGDPNGAGIRFERVARSEPNYTTAFTAFRESIWTYLGRAQYQTGKLAEAQASFEKALAHLGEDQIARLYLGLTLLRQPPPPKPTNSLSLQEISYALREGIEPKRVATLARERGVDFDLTRESENHLRKAGADDPLLSDIKRMRAEFIKRDKAAGQATRELKTALAGLRESLDYTIAHTPQGKFWDPAGEIRSQIESCLALLAAREPELPKIISIGERVGQKLEEEIDLARRDERQDFRTRPR